MTEFLASPVLRGAFAGWLAAAAVDFAAFRSWQSFEQARLYNWPLALWRWLQGAVIGAVTGGGFILAG